MSDSSIPSGETASEPRLNVLVLYALPSDAVAETIRSSLRAFDSFSRHRIFYAETMVCGIANIDLSKFDAIVIHYSIVLALPYRENYLKEFELLCQFQGIKVVFIQDDYRWVNATVDALTTLGVDVLFTCVGKEDYMKVYADERLARVRIVSIFAGHVDQRLLCRSVPPYAERRLDVGYRAQNLTGKLAWLGELAQEKTWIAGRFLEDAQKFGLNVDISCDPSRRLNGEDWFDFTASCRAVLGSESGASICDKTGEIQQATLAYVTDHPDATFQEVRDACFPSKDFVTPVRSLSPRVFEAAALRTLMICYPGSYGGVLVPWRHYVPLEKDHSNIAEVVSVLRDEKRASRIIDQAYSEIACNPAYMESSVTFQFDQELALAIQAKGRPPVSSCYHSFDFQATLVKRPRDTIIAAEKLTQDLWARNREERQRKQQYREDLNTLRSKTKEKKRRSRLSTLLERLKLLLRKPQS